MIEFRNFSFRYSSDKNLALSRINLRIEPGEFVLVVGDSGSGKTTLLRSINGLIPHFYGGEYEGEVSVEGMEVKKTPPREIAMHVGTVLQDPENQLLMENVEREIAFPLENMGFSPSEITKRVEESLDILNIPKLRYRKITTLSGGEKQKVAIASSIAAHPSILILDEPTSQIDPASGEEILSLLERINDELGVTIMLVEHRMGRVVHRADRLIVLSGGKIIGDGEPRIVLSRLDMDKIGVGYPPVAKVAKMAHKDYIPLTVKEGRKILRDIFLNVRLKKEVEKKREIIMVLKSINFSYDKNRVIKNLNLKIRKNEILGLIGRNGSGKTTLAKIIMGILKIQSGKITFENKNYYSIKTPLVGMVFQNPNLHIIGDSVYDDIAYTLRGRGEKEEKVREIMKELGIEHLQDKNPMDLSGGEKMFVAIATVAVWDPKIFILDEPTRGLSHSQKMKLLKFMKKYATQGSVIFISHDMEMVARASDRVAVISEGKIIMEGNKRDIMSGSLVFSPQLNKVVQGYRDMKNVKNLLTVEDMEGLN